MDELAILLKLTQEQLKQKLYKLLVKKGMNPVNMDGFLYAKGEIPVLLVAHMDTVASEPPKALAYKEKHNKIYNPSGILGGDDRCGVYAILSLLKKYNPHILFTEDEEIGCLGASKTIEKLDVPNVKYIIEFDRRGSDDCVFYDCGNQEFIDYIESFGFKLKHGSYSDISVLSGAWDIASVNLSVGYYNEHTKDEYIIFSELLNTIKKTENILNDISKAPYFDYQEIKYNMTNNIIDLYKLYMYNMYNCEDNSKTLTLKPDKKKKQRADLDEI